MTSSQGTLSYCSILLALLAGEICVLPAAAAPKPYRGADVRVLNSKAGFPPKITFAFDGPTAQLKSLLAQPDVIADLKRLKGGVAVSLPDLTAERAQVIGEWNQAEIPVTAWLTLPGNEGYYLNAGNEPEAAARFSEFELWTATYGLHWAAIGLDFEPSLQDFSALQNNKMRLAATLSVRYFEFSRVQRAKKLYAALIEKMQADGYVVETYQFPFIADERKMHATLLERLAGIVDVRGNTEALMLYTSFNPKIDSALIWVYGAEAQAIALGSTAGSDSDSRFVPLNWEEFSRDLIVAHHFSKTVGVYNLEGCIRQGFLSRLVTMDWGREVVIPAEAIQKATNFRARLQMVIWIGSHLLDFALILVIAAAAGISLRWMKRARY